MIKSKRLVFIPILIVILLILGNMVTPAQANNTDLATGTPTGTPAGTDPSGEGEAASPEQQEELKAVIQAYFEMRYQSNSVSQPVGSQLESFGELVSDEVDANPFKDTELAKLALEKKHAELNELRYVDYKYFLDFRSITVDPNARKATVAVVEDNEVIYEMSVKVNPEEPVVSRRFNVEHTIVLKLKKDQWKIVSDDYNDYLWMMLRGKKKKSIDEIIQSTDELLNNMEPAPGPTMTSSSVEAVTALSSLPADPSSHPYDRDTAAAWSHTFANSDDAQYEYNQNYWNFPSTDCQNFVSQGIYEGGKASMDFPYGPLPPPNWDGQNGWYYLSELQHSGSWQDVQQFYNFVTDRSESIKEGPEGYEIPRPANKNEVPPTLMAGDVIQFLWNDPDDPNDLWDHSVLVDTIIGGMPYINSHTTDYQSEPFSTFVYKGYKDVRYLHIERSDGYPPVKVQIVAANDDASGNPSGACPVTNYDSGNNYLGGCFNGSLNGVTSGFLFRYVDIPRGAQIKYAYISFTTDGTYVPVEGMSGVVAPIHLKIYGEDSAAPLDFGPLNPPPSARTPVPGVAPVPWDIDGTVSLEYDTWRWKGKRATPDIAPIIQAIVNRGDWAPGKSLSILLKNGLDGDTYARRVLAYEALQEPNGLTPTRLIVAYETTTAQSVPYPFDAAKDGWVLESSETSNKGGSLNSNYTTFYVGDDSSDKQYKSILHFDTNSLPDNAVITSVVLKLKQHMIQGTDPFTTHGNMLVSIKKPAFGTANLAKSDFEAEADMLSAAIVDPEPSGEGYDLWYTAQLYSTAFPYVNRTGSTQFRLGFMNDDDDDLSADYISFWSGDNWMDQPQLIITYYLP